LLLNGRACVAVATPKATLKSEARRAEVRFTA
jgi:hypothetical protein